MNIDMFQSQFPFLNPNHHEFNVANNIFLHLTKTSLLKWQKLKTLVYEKKNFNSR